MARRFTYLNDSFDLTQVFVHTLPDVDVSYAAIDAVTNFPSSRLSFVMGGADKLAPTLYADVPTGPLEAAPRSQFPVFSLDGANGTVFSGIEFSDFSGVSVSSAGDFNGDGFDDFLIGARGGDTNGGSAGETYLIYGTAAGYGANMSLSSFDGINGVVFNGAALSDESGTSVTSIGDFNGDGFDDIMIGAPGVDANGSSSGAAYVIFGTAANLGGSFELSSLNGTNGFVANGASSFDQVGLALSDAGDVNNDGLADFIIGSRGAGSAGVSYVVFGTNVVGTGALELSDLNGTNGFALIGSSTGDNSGYSVSSAGDINGDGIDDVLVGAPNADPNGTSSGEIYVVFGSDTGFAPSINLMVLNGTDGFTIRGAGASDTAGRSVANVGDVNNDGIDDILIGANFADPNGVGNAGASYIVYGSDTGFAPVIELSTISGAGGTTISGIDVGDASGISVASAGDVNGDGFADFIIGANFADPHGVEDGGESYVIFGTANGLPAFIDLDGLDSFFGFVINGLGDDDQSGESVSAAGDVNGDGFDDLLIGASHANSNGSNSGATYLIYGSATIGQTAALNSSIFELEGLDGASGFFLSGLASGDGLGRSVAGAGDINNDGFADVIIGATGAGANSQGVTYIVFGSASGFSQADFDIGSLDGTNGFVIEGLSAFDSFGQSVARLEDVNGDNIDDLIIGAPFVAEASGTTQGAAYVIFGSSTPFSANFDISSLNGTNGFSISTTVNNQNLGSSVASAGDVNGDGIADIIIGGNGSFEQGVQSSVYVVFGSNLTFTPNIDVSSLDGTNGFAMPVGDQGMTVTGIGDFNADGVDDLLVGVPTVTGTDASYVVFGQIGGFSAVVDVATFNSTIGFQIAGGVSNGRGVANIGDVNGDGIVDLLIGSDNASPNGSDSGEAYIIFGSAATFLPVFDVTTLDGTNGFTISGLSASDELGAAVAGVGDFNGDGFNDIVIGATGADYLGVEAAGTTYIIFGTDQGFAANIDLSTLDGSNGLALHGINAFDHAGSAVAGAGDVNGDGFDDLIVGASSGGPSGDNEGQAYIIYGFASPAAPVNAAPIASNDDLVVTEDTINVTANVLADNGNGVDTDADGDTLTIIEVNGVSTNVGSSVAGSSGGDFTIDANGSVTFVTGLSFNDLAVGEHRDTSVVYTVSDGNGGAATATVLVRVDGVNDAVFLFDPANSGSPLDPSNYIPAQSVIDGAAVTDLDLSPFFGDDDASDTITITIAIADLPPGMFYSVSTNTISGTPTANASQGGPNNDGIYTILVTATDSGGAQVTTNVTYTVTNTIPVAQSDTLNVSSVANRINLFADNGAGADTDADGDTLSIVAIDGVAITVGDSIALANGLTIFYSGGGSFEAFSTDLLVSNVSLLPGQSITETFSYTVSDGEGGTDTVSATVNFVQNSLDITAFDGTVSSLISAEVSGRMGISVSDLGDVNGDGFADVIVGANRASPNGNAVAGESYVVFGSATGIANIDVTILNGTNGFVIQGINIGDQSGFSVSGAGDVNGDGIDDILVGAFAASGSNGDTGLSYVVYGTNTGFTSILHLADINGTNGFVLNGEDIGDFSGTSVSGIGDINGDGFDDIIIGAPGFDASPFDAGASYVVFGGNAIPLTVELSALDGTNGFVVNGPSFGSDSGTSVSDAGDVNGDGIADFIIGAPGQDTGGFIDNGVSYVVFGRDAVTPFAASLDLSALDGTNGFSISGADNGDESGVSVSSAGDVNGDGIDDILIGASAANPNGDESGETYVVFGTDQGFSANIDLSTLDGTNGFAITGSISGSFSGASVSNIGDFNGDGFDDIIIGASRANRDGNNDIGESYLVYGSASGFSAVLNVEDLDGTNGFFIFGLDALDESGVSVSGAGDLNGDGLADLIIGADRADFLSGEAYIIYGFTQDSLPEANDDSFETFPGQDITANVFEENGNGIDRDNDGDAISVTAVNGVSTNVGTAIAGDNGGQFTIDSNGDLTFSQNGDFDALIRDANTTTSVTYEISDDDGNTSTATTSVVVTGQNHDPSAQDDVFATNVTNSVTGNVFDDNGNGVDADFDGDTLTVSNVNGVEFNVNSAIAGDNGGLFTINTDGSYTFDPNGDYAGLEPGNSSETSVNYTVNDGFGGFTNATVTVTVTAPHITDALNDTIVTDTADNVMNVFADNGNGADIDSAGDGLIITMINGVAVTVGDTVTLTSGAVIEYLGEGNIAIEATDFGLFTDTFTYTASNGLGQTDTAAVISTFANNRLFLDTLDGTNGFTLLNGNSGDEVGFSVSDAGDLNNDGFDDILIGAHFANPNGQDDAGQTFVVFGSGSGFNPNLDLNALNGTNGFVLNGIAAYDNSGWSVSSAGDVNGDGIDDILIGAQLADPNRIAQSGQTYVIFGSDSGFSASLDLASLDGTNGFTINGIDLNDQSGLSVSGIGDVNGDGVDDILIGARAADPLGNNLSGESYVIFGSANGFTDVFEVSDMTAAQGFTINGVGEGDQSGYSVSGAGDVNGDGITDLIVGAYLSDANGDDSGTAYIVFGSDGFGTSLDLSSLDGTTGFTINGTRAGDQLGVSVSSAGDVNGDGIDDLIIGARFTASSGTESGTTYVVFGTASGFSADFDLLGLDGINGFAIFGMAAGDQSGMTVANVGDFNGDGFDDILIGAAGADPQGSSDAGESYLIFGSASGFDADFDLSDLDGDNGLIISGIGENDRSGFSVSGAGDVNGDGLADLIVGAPGAGDSYLIFGVSAFTTVVTTSSPLSNSADNFYGTNLGDIIYGLDGNDELDGSGGDDQVFGDSGTDVLRGAQGNDILFGGVDADIFVFTNDGGNDVILDFEAGVDRIAINRSAFTSYADIQAAMTDIGADMMIDFGGNHGSVLLQGVNMSDLDMSDFLLNGVNVRTILPTVDKTEIVPVMPVMEDLTSEDKKGGTADKGPVVSEILPSENVSTEDLPIDETLTKLSAHDDGGLYLSLYNMTAWFGVFGQYGLNVDVDIADYDFF